MGNPLCLCGVQPLASLFLFVALCLHSARFVQPANTVITPPPQSADPPTGLGMRLLSPLHHRDKRGACSAGGGGRLGPHVGKATDKASHASIPLCCGEKRGGRRGCKKGTRYLLYLGPRFESRCGRRRLRPSAPTLRNKPAHSHDSLFRHSDGGIKSGSAFFRFFHPYIP